MVSADGSLNRTIVEPKSVEELAEKFVGGQGGRECRGPRRGGGHIIKKGGARSHARDLSQQSTRYHSQGVVLQLLIYNKALQVRRSLGLESERAPLQIMFKRNRLVDACGDI